jgi:3-dehydroquinate dehydratase-2
VRFYIINGPNLNLLGTRNPAVYGSVTFDDYLKDLRVRFPDQTIDYYQTNYEGSIIDKLHEIGFDAQGIVLNPGAYGHTSIAIRDAIEAITTPVVEVHISDVASREPFRRHSMIADVCLTQISGKGLDGYREALELLIGAKH